MAVTYCTEPSAAAELDVDRFCNGHSACWKTTQLAPLKVFKKTLVITDTLLVEGKNSVNKQAQLLAWIDESFEIYFLIEHFGELELVKITSEAVFEQSKNQAIARPIETVQAFQLSDTTNFFRPVSAQPGTSV